MRDLPVPAVAANSATLDGPDRLRNPHPASRQTQTHHNGHRLQGARRHAPGRIGLPRPTSCTLHLVSAGGAARITRARPGVLWAQHPDREFCEIRLAEPIRADEALALFIDAIAQPTASSPGGGGLTSASDGMVRGEAREP